jgi:hypothetical protein
VSSTAFSSNGMRQLFLYFERYSFFWQSLGKFVAVGNDRGRVLLYKLRHFSM